MKILNQLFARTHVAAVLALTLLPALAQAHPGHGLGPVGHDLQHALWNFTGMAILATLILLAAKLPVARVQTIRKYFRRDGRGHQ